MVPSLLSLFLPFCLFTTGSPVLASGNSTEPQEGSNFNSSTTIAPFLEKKYTATQYAKVTQSNQSTRERILYVTSGPEDYYYDDDSGGDEETKVIESPPAPSSPCPYDRCEHLLPTCEEIQKQAGGRCLCPGITGSKTKPDPPRLVQALLADGKLSVNWCSPLSTVRGYRVLYRGLQGPMETGPVLNASYRSYSIENLPDTHYTVCVVAFNEAGESPAAVDEEDNGPEGSMTGPCRNLHTTLSKDSYIYLGVGLGLAALAGLLVVLGCWLWKRERSNKMYVAEEEEMGIPNHFYKAESANQL
ncbi:LRRN4 C-terminal-like protein [Pseudophryne corroboree]|uniref:LRRN4 C-terminal-like protein n=1 Tax=Pseudophryne corroboree TaxID=495146 RepID=UPI0030820A16